MSRVLRRPMFRGGYVDSEGTGITSGLMESREGYREGEFVPKSPAELARYNALKRQLETYDPVREVQEELRARIERSTRNPFTYTESFGSPDPNTYEFFTSPEGKSYIEEEIKKKRQPLEQEFAKYKLEPKQSVAEFGFKTKPKDDTEPPPPPNVKEVVKSDFKTVYEDLLPLFTRELGAAEDEFSRQKYLELAKFGLNLLRQPGGPAGGKRDLLGAIAASAEKPLEGYQAILAKEKQAQRLPKALALEAAMKEAEPGSIGKAVKDLKRLGIPENKAIEMATQTGSATKEQTYEAVIRNIQEGLVKNGIVTDDYAARTTAQELLTAERQGVPSALFEKFPANPIEGSYYIMKNGQSGRYYQGKLIKPGEKGFTGPLSK